jgi:hypothetical protein
MPDLPSDGDGQRATQDAVNGEEPTIPRAAHPQGHDPGCREGDHQDGEQPIEGRGGHGATMRLLA